MAFGGALTTACLALALCHCYGLETVFKWNDLHFDVDDADALLSDIKLSDFIWGNHLATGIAVDTDDKIFITIPRRKDGIPCTVAAVDLKTWAYVAGKPSSPKLTCWPSFAAQKTSSCDNIISSNKGVRVDKHDRVIVYDSGKIGTDKNSQQLCPPRIHIFDKLTGFKLHQYAIPEAVSQLNHEPEPIPVAIVVDSGDKPTDLHIYIGDQKGIIVYSYAKDKAWRVSHPFFSYDPLKTNFHIGPLEYQFKYAGVYGLALSGVNPGGFKTLYFHSFASNEEFAVSTKILKDESKASDNYFDFFHLGSRGYLGESGAQVVHKPTGVLFQTLPGHNATACWNPNKPYNIYNVHIVAKNDEELVFPTDLVIDGHDSVWVLSNKLPIYNYGVLDITKPQFHILKASVSDLIKHSGCA